MSKKKVLRSINRGFLLSMVIIIGVVLFLFLQGKADDKLEQELKSMTVEFMADCDKVVILPEEQRVFAETEEDFNKLFSESTVINFDYTNDMNRFYSENTALREWAKSWLENCVSNQVTNQKYITSYKTDIVQFNSFSVYKGRATLSFDVLSSGEAVTREGTPPVGPSQTTETLIFEEENGKWIITEYVTYRFWNELSDYSDEVTAW